MNNKNFAPAQKNHELVRELIEHLLRNAKPLVAFAGATGGVAVPGVDRPRVMSNALELAVTDGKRS